MDDGIVTHPAQTGGHICLDPELMIKKYEMAIACDAVPDNRTKKYSRFPFSTEDYLEKIRSTTLRDDDILIGGYPKTGHTLAEAIVTLVINDGDVSRLNDEYNFMRTPFLDAFDDEHENGIVRMAMSRRRPRTIRTHLPADLLPSDAYQRQVKIVYTYRDVKDTMVSFYHFCRSYKQLGLFEGDWNDFYEIVMSGDVPYGDAVEHYRSWWAERGRLNVLFISYEELTRRRAESIRNLASFLDKDLDLAQVENIVNATSFQSMKKNDKVNMAPLTMAIDQSISPFIRKGIVGDWKNHFSFEQAKRFDAKFQDQLSEMSEMFDRV